MDVFLCASGPHLGGLTDRSAIARDAEQFVGASPLRTAETLCRNADLAAFVAKAVTGADRTAGKEVVRTFDPCFSGTTRAVRASPAPRHRLLER